MVVKNFPTAEVAQDAACQMRAAVHEDAVAEYTETLLAGVELPPIDVVLVLGVPYVVDGFHRLAAYRAAGAAFVPCRVVADGTLRDATLRAVGANAGHGLRRSNADKRKAVETLLRDAEWTRWSNREIAGHCHVSPDLVDRLRGSLSDSGSEPATPGEITRKYVTKHGTEATMNVAKIGKSKASKPVEKPEPSRPIPVAESRVEIDGPASDEAGVPDAPKRAQVDEYADHLRLLRSRMGDAFRGTHLAQNGAFELLKRAEGLLRMAAPIDCPTCGGSAKGCRSCGARGWVTRGDARSIERDAS